MPLRFLTAGESHGPALTVIVEGMPAGVPVDRAAIDRYRCELAQELARVGMPPRLTLRAAHWPCLAVRLSVEAIYVQTPGPGAGAPLGAGEGGPR